MSETLKGHLDPLILAVLANDPLHGYAVIEELKARSGGELDSRTREWRTFARVVDAVLP